MNAIKFKEYLDKFCDWSMTVHNSYTALKTRSKTTSNQPKRPGPAKKIPISVDELDELYKEIDDSESNLKQHNSTIYPVVFRHKPVKSTCELCDSEVISQNFVYKLREGSYTRKCSICRKTEDIKMKKKINDK